MWNKRRHKLQCVWDSPRPDIWMFVVLCSIHTAYQNKSALQRHGNKFFGARGLCLILPKVLMIIALNAMTCFCLSHFCIQFTSVYIYIFLKFFQLNILPVMLTCLYHISELLFENVYVDWTKTSISIRSEYFQRVLLSYCQFLFLFRFCLMFFIEKIFQDHRKYPATKKVA